MSVENAFHELIQLSDPHLFADASTELKGVPTRESFRRVLTAALSQCPDADILMVTGDIAQDESKGAYEAFRAMVAKPGKPVCCIPGNHDDPELMKSILDADPLQLGGELILGNWLVVLLDTWDGDRGGGRLGGQALADLERRLAGTDRDHVLVVLHHHPVPVGSAWLDSVALDDGPEFMEVIRQAPKVRGVLWGHVHQDFDREFDGRMRLMGCPSTCFQFQPNHDVFSLDALPPGYRRVRLYNDGHMETRVFRVRGAYAMPGTLETAASELVRHYRLLRQHGLNDSHSGNASVKLGDRVLVTPTGCCADTLFPADLVECALAGQATEGASLDAPLHLAIYDAVPEARAVLHSHAPHAIALTLDADEFAPEDFEGQYYFGSVPVLGIPYDQYLQRAPQEVAAALTDSPVCIVRGHGVYARGETLDRAYKWTCSLESSARISWLRRRGPGG